MNSKQLLIQAASVLKQAHVEQAILDAQLLLMFCWQKDLVQLIIAADVIPPQAVLNQFEALIQRRKSGEPVAYLCSEKEFYSRMFYVDHNVLIPRPETEHLIEAVQHHFQDADATRSFCDVGTGSGCIAVTLACEFQQAQVYATDISDKALRVAKKNAHTHGVDARIQFMQGNMLKALDPQHTFDLIVSNPPYVTLDEYQTLAPELYFEPRQALTDEHDGLFFLKELLDTAPQYLKKHGKLIVETGICGLAPNSKHMQHLEDIIDLAGHLRGAVYEKC